MRRNAEVRGNSRSLLSIPKRRQSLAEGKLLSVRDALQFSWGFLCLSFCCRNNTTNDRDVLGLFLSVFSSCLLFAEQISGTRSDRTRASSCLCLSPVSPLPIPQTQSAFHPHAQRNADRHRGVRQKCCFITHHGGRTDAYLLAQGSNYSVTSIGTTWEARCDDSFGAAVPIEVSPVRVLPEPGKCVGLAGF